MKSIKYNTQTGEIDFANGKLTTLTGKDAMKQNIISFLHIAKGEYFLNKNYGIDYFNTGYTTENAKELFDAQVIYWLKQKPFILSISGYSSTFNDPNLEVTIENIETSDGLIQISEVI